jgi:23S rRNA (cytidine1920-2'-O)/16S rRNA (cytidine1409-2'-O)-methyltransferase
MPLNGKVRLTELLVARGLSADIPAAERAVLAGDVLVSGQPVSQPSLAVGQDCEVSLKQRSAYVSRGGYKLAGALADFRFNVTGLRCMDVGASSGGFTDCLLQLGAASVVAVDVAYGQFDWKLRNDPRVQLLERHNIRDLADSDFDAPIDLMVVDLSFTRLSSMFSVLRRLLLPYGWIVALVKPQFELDAAEVGSGGIVRKPHLHEKALQMAVDGAAAQGFVAKQVKPSRLRGSKGNQEYFLLAQLAPAAVSDAPPQSPAAAHLYIAGEAVIGQHQSQMAAPPAAPAAAPHLPDPPPTAAPQGQAAQLAPAVAIQPQGQDAVRQLHDNVVATGKADVVSLAFEADGLANTANTAADLVGSVASAAADAAPALDIAGVVEGVFSLLDW